MKVNGEGRLEQVKDKDGKAKQVSRDGKLVFVWRGRFNLGYDKETKRYVRTPWRMFYGSKGEARSGLEAYRNELERGIEVNADSLLFSDWADTFCSGREVKNAASPATLKHDRNQVRILNLYLGKTKVRDIDAATVDHVLVAMGKDGRSANAIKRAFAILKRLMKKACRQGIILDDPTEYVEPPRAEKPEIKALSEERAALLQEALKHQPEYLNKASEQNRLSNLSNAIATRFLLCSGCRRGEALGLTWRHIDFAGSKVRIEQQLTITGIRTPKTKAGRRTLSLDSEIMALLKKWKTTQAEWLLKQGIGQNETTPIFSTTGHFYRVDDYSHWWQKFRKLSGFQDVSTHMLRHTHATLLIGAGVDIKTVQHRLGHESASITMNLYAHFIEHKDDECVAVMDALHKKPVKKLATVVGF